MVDLSDTNRFNSSRAELFEALGHPVRIKILESLKEGPLGFAELKRRAGLESSGNLQFHLAMLGDLVRAQPDGNYSLTDEGREATRVVEATGQVTTVRNSARPLAGLRRTVKVSTILLVCLIVVGVTLAGVGNFLTAETEVSAAAPSSIASTFSFLMAPGEHHFIFGNGGPNGVSGTYHLQGVVLLDQRSSTDRVGVTVEVDVNGSINGTVYQFDNVGDLISVNSDISLQKGISQVSVSLVNPSGENVTVAGDYFTWGRVVHPNEGVGSGLLYFGALVALIGAVLLVRSFLLARKGTSAAASPT